MRVENLSAIADADATSTYPTSLAEAMHGWHQSRVAAASVPIPAEKN